MYILFRQFNNFPYCFSNSFLKKREKHICYKCRDTRGACSNIRFHERLIHSRNDLYSDSRCNRVSIAIDTFFFFSLFTRTYVAWKEIRNPSYFSRLTEPEGRKEGRKKRVVRDQEVEKRGGGRERERDRETRAACCCCCCCWRSWHDKKR